MKYFKNQNGVVFAYDDDVSLDLINALRPGLVAMTSEEVTAHLNPPEPQINSDQLKAAVTAFRWKVETGGITLPSGVAVATAIDDQNRITSVVANAERAGLDEVDFKSAQGWVKITLAELQAIAAAVARHVQACFSAERAHHEAIDALQAQHSSAPQVLQAALNAYDVAQGWPSADLRLPG